MGVELQGIPEDAAGAAPVAPQCTYNPDRLLPILETIRPAFDDDDAFYGFLEVMAQKFAATPDTFKTMMGYGGA